MGHEVPSFNPFTHVHICCIGFSSFIQDAMHTKQNWHHAIVPVHSPCCIIKQSASRIKVAKKDCFVRSRSTKRCTLIVVTTGFFKQSWQVPRKIDSAPPNLRRWAPRDEGMHARISIVNAERLEPKIHCVSKWFRVWRSVRRKNRFFEKIFSC